MLQFKWLGEQGKETPLPSKAHDSDIGYDLTNYKFVKDEVINVGDKEVVVGSRYTFGYGVKFPK